MTPQMKKIKEIYLTAGDEDENLVWCEDKVTDEDVKYIRADILKSSLLSQKKEFRKMVEGMKKKDLWHWMDFADNGFAEGVCEYKDAPKGVDGHTAEFVYNKALEDILENLKQ